MTTDYGQTIHLPKTDFPRRAGLAQKEPEILARWEKMGLYARQRQESKSKEKFILHMGPPFANGHIHLGHVLSTVLKDVVCRSYQMMGFDAPLVPGWDCHGLPIEWKIEEKYRKENKNFRKEDADPADFRKDCRSFAAEWVDVQAGEFKRLGINADYVQPYKTMDKKSEALIAGEVFKFLKTGSLYRGSKPVMWSIPEQTALAEAEIEYKDMTSDTVWVKFPVKSGPKEIQGASVVIWTTTPWTLPGNRAIGYGADIDYFVHEVTKVEEDAFVKAGDKLVIARGLQVPLMSAGKISTTQFLDKPIKGKDLEGTICQHPLHAQGYTFDVPLLAGDFVTTDAGTGFVHIAPGHGEDDYRLGLKHGIEVPQTVGGDGKYFDSVPVFAGAAVYYPDGKKGPANKLVIEAIQNAGYLAARGQIQHSYPHSWRSKAPVIFRNTPQWFISMEKNDLRKRAASEIEKTRFVPAKGKNRIGAMIEQRGDWCVSRQRAWGVPIALFVNKKTGEALVDDAVFENIVHIFTAEGSDAWFTRPASDFLGSKHNAADYDQVKDIIDVWFESGSTQGFVLEQHPDQRRPADLYLEGSDQHRGWFQSSLLVGVGTRGNAPFKAVLTHGFILDEKGYKMSKSTGNVTSPIALMQNYGADILRLWTTGSDYTEDIKFGENILKAHSDVYRRIRNTFCYLLGSLDGTGSDKNLSDLDKYILHRVFEIDRDIRKAISDFDFQGMTTLIHNFCARELSAFYFDICKDALYCEALTSPKRKAIVYVLDQVFNYLVHWLSPVLSFTCEEAWLSYKGLTLDDTSESIHLSALKPAPTAWRNNALADKWESLMTIRETVTGALELKRAEKEIGSSLEAWPTVYFDAAGSEHQITGLNGISFSDVCITSGIEVEYTKEIPKDAYVRHESVFPVGVKFVKATDKGANKCERCWRYTDDIGAVTGHDTACKRCGEAVEAEKKSAAA